MTQNTDQETSREDSDTRVIEVDAATYERFEGERQKTKSDHAPAMDEGTFLSALLDTNKAVREGYYDGE